MSKWSDSILEVFSPKGLLCMVCDGLSYGGYLCVNCRKALNALRIKTADANEESVRSVYRYDGVPKKLVCMLKFDLQTDAAEVLADAMAEEILRMNLPPETVLTWVTMPDIRRIKRGIDHGRILCEAVASRVHFPVKQLLIRTRRNLHTQRGLGRKRRMKNLQGTIVCRERISGTVVLIDDVTTSGATAEVCTEVLLKAGAERVIPLAATKAILWQDNLDYYKEVTNYGFHPV